MPKKMEIDLLASRHPINLAGQDPCLLHNPSIREKHVAEAIEKWKKKSP